MYSIKERREVLGMSVIMLILVIICAVMVNRFYHKLFSITYFGFKPLITEWIVCFMIGAMIVGVVFNFLGLN